MYPTAVNEVLSNLVEQNSRLVGFFGEAEVHETRFSMKSIERHLRRFKGRCEASRQLIQPYSSFNVNHTLSKSLTNVSKGRAIRAPLFRTYERKRVESRAGYSRETRSNDALQEQ